MCKQDKVASKKGLKEKKRFQHNIVYLFPGIPTDPDNEVFTVNGRKHTYTHSYTSPNQVNTIQHEPSRVQH